VPTLDLGRVVPTINGIEADENGNIVIDNVAHAETADSAANATTADNATKLGNQNPSYYYAGAPNYTYDGRDLKAIFGTAAAFRAAVAAGDFSNIRNGDYWPITLTGTYYDYGKYQAPNGATTYSDAACTAAAGTLTAATEVFYVNETACANAQSDISYYVKTTDCTPYVPVAISNQTFKLEVNVNTYWKYGDSGSVATGSNHILFCSRDLINRLLLMRKAASVWTDTSVTNPWLGSALYKTLNDPDHGILPLLKATDIGAYIYSGPNGNGMRFLGETKASGASTATGWTWIDRGMLFLPTEREVWGQDVWSEHTNGGGAAVQWPIFSGTLRHIIKGLGNGGGRSRWWVQSSYAGSASNFCNADSDGIPYLNSASITWVGAPLCFLIV